MEKIVKKFWYGEITLWRSYWLVGELLNALVILIIFNIEIRIFNNSLINNLFPFLNFNNFNLLSKLILIFWTLFITIGIWRSAEKYNGSFAWIVLTLIFLSYRIFSLRIVLPLRSNSIAGTTTSLIAYSILDARFDTGNLSI